MLLACLARSMPTRQIVSVLIIRCQTVSVLIIRCQTVSVLIISVLMISVGAFS